VTTTITATIGLLCLALAFIMWWKVPDFKFGPIIQIALIITGSVGIANTFAGQWIRGVVGWVSRAIGSLFGMAFGVAVPWILALIFAAVVIFELIKMGKEKSKLIADASGQVGVSAFLLPLVASAIPGVVGATIVGGLAAISRGVGTVVAAGFGLR
jgi:hypothetical protein